MRGQLRNVYCAQPRPPGAVCYTTKTMSKTTRAMFFICLLVVVAAVYVVVSRLYRYSTPWRLPLPHKEPSLPHISQFLSTLNESSSLILSTVYSTSKPLTTASNQLHELTSQEELSQPESLRGALHRWRLYGANSTAVNSDNLGQQKQKQGTKLFSDLSTDVQRVVERLQAVPISCNSHPKSSQKLMTEKFGKFLEALSNYASLHAQNRGSDNAKKLVWYCGENFCGGLGDRERGLTYALILAMMSQRVLLFHWQDSRLDNKTYLDPNVIDWRLTEKERKKVFEIKNHFRVNEAGDSDAVMLLSLFSRGPMDTTESATRHKSVLQAMVGHRPWIALQSNMFPSSLVYGRVPVSMDWIKQGMGTLGLNKLSQFEINQVMGLAFRYLFTFSKGIVAEMDEARRILGLVNQAYVGVHLRTGFEGSKKHEENNHPKLIKDRWQWEATLNCAYTHATDIILGKNALIFLATDSALVKAMALQKYKDRVRSLNNSVIHIDDFTPPPEEVGDFEREGVMSVWVELVLLAEAHSLIIGRSGFSFLAQSLCLVQQPLLLNGVTCKSLDNIGM